MIEFSECKRKNLCVDCDNAKCLNHGRIMADCPKYECDNEDLYECEKEDDLEG